MKRFVQVFRAPGLPSTISALQNGAGFTVLELLVLSGVFAAVGFMVTASLFNVLRGSVKTETVRSVKQNGEFAMATMERMVRNAADVPGACDGSPTSALTITTQRDEAVTFSCDFVDGSAQIASTSAIDTGHLTGSTVTLGASCPGTLQFRCTSASNTPKRVDIQFSLRQSATGVENFETAAERFQTTVTLRNQ